MPAVETKYAERHDGRFVAYQVTGSGPRTLLLTFGHGISVEDQMEGRLCRAFIDRLSSFARVLRFDRSGTGLSDPVPAIDATAYERWVDDAVAVLDAVGVETVSEVTVDMTAAPMSLLFAATKPERVDRLVLFNPAARWNPAPDFPWGLEPEVREQFIADIRAEWRGGESPVFRNSPSALHDDELKRWWAQARRRGMSPSTAEAVYRNGQGSDFRAILPTIRVPTLVLFRPPPGEVEARARGQAQNVADNIPDARFVEVPGHDVFAYLGDAEPVVQEIEEFLTGTRSQPPSDRVLATVLFTDLVASTEQAARVGDRAWREHLDRHDAMVRACLQQFRGREIKMTGDGLLATFDGPARAINCAVAITKGAEAIGLECRAGLHTGEIELRGDDIGGLAVHIGARVAANAGPSEVLVSRTVVDLVAGSGLAFTDRGEQELKGIDGSWRLFAVGD